MNLYNLKCVCANIHRKALADLSILGQDMFLVAANNARRNGEMLHNFEMTRVEGTLTIDPHTGGSLNSVVIGDDTTAIATVSGTLVPNVAGVYYKVGTNAAGDNVYAKSVNGVYYTIGYTGSNWVISTNDAVSYWFSPTFAGAYDVGGSAVGTATVAGTTGVSVWGGIKEVVALTRTNADFSRVPLDFQRADVPIEWDRAYRQLSDNSYTRDRYPSDADLLSVTARVAVVQRRRSLFIYPVPSTSVTDSLIVNIEGYAWLPPYTTIGSSGDADQDFFLTYGTSYMQWAIVNELNTLFQTFVARQEGVLVEPQAKADVAWKDFVLWDSFQVDSHANYRR